MTAEVSARHDEVPDDRRPRPKPALPVSWPRVQLAGTTTDLFEADDAIGVIIEHASDVSAEGVLGVVSVNLDHLHHFGSGRASARLEKKSIISTSLVGQVQWMALLDGAPLVHKAGDLTGRPWPRLAGSDLIEPLLDEAAARHLRVGFLGGSSQTHRELRPILASRWPELPVAGFWSPPRHHLDDADLAGQLAAEIKAARVDVLAVCLGKPRQERWIAEYGAASGARVCLAFGAVVDFLAERVGRAPRWIADHGLEWAWRLANEPKRLARRYLIQGPPAYRALHNDSFVMMPTTYFSEPATSLHPTLPLGASVGAFAGHREHADVAAIIVTYNNAPDVDPLIESLRRQTGDQSLRVVVVDNASTDGTLDLVRRHPDVVAVDGGGNLGYAGGINVARRHLGLTDSVLILNPDLVMEPGALRALRERLLHGKVGVAVPRMLDADGQVYASLRREPSLTRALGDALVGERFAGRPGWLSEIEFNQRVYRYPHQIDWATGAAMLIRADVDRTVGEWDERYFLYSEETDYLRRVRESGEKVWFEPQATVKHRRGGSGASDELEALMAVNRVRYQESVRGPVTVAAFRALVITGSLLRLKQSRHRVAVRYLVSRKSWDELPQADRTSGSVAR